MKTTTSVATVCLLLTALSVDAAEPPRVPPQAPAAASAEEERDLWLRRITLQIHINWSASSLARRGIQCVLHVTWEPERDRVLVTNVSIGACTGDTWEQKSIVAAAYRVSSLPLPPYAALLDRDLIVNFIVPLQPAPAISPPGTPWPPPSSGGLQPRELERQRLEHFESMLEHIESALPQRARQSGGRSREEIESVFDGNKGAIYKLYKQALSENPHLRGKLVLEFTIAPSGAVTMCRMVSTDLNDNNDLEEKIIARVRAFRFEPKDVESVTTTKPIDFFPG